MWSTRAFLTSACFVWVLLGGLYLATGGDPQQQQPQQGGGAALTSEYTYKKAMAWYEVYGVKHTPPSQQVNDCLKEVGPPNGARVSNSLAVVMTHPVKTALSQAVMDSWVSYCQLHGCKFVHCTATKYQRPADLPYSPWLCLFNNEIWMEHEWILHVQDSVMVMNMDRPFYPILTKGAPDLIFGMSEEGMVSPNAVFIRTTPFSQCFIKHWVNYAAVPRTDSRVGDLQQAVMDFVDPDLAQYCDTQRPWLDEKTGEQLWEKYKVLYKPCVLRVLAKLPMVHLALPMRFYFPMTSLLHTMRGNEPSDLIATTQQALWEGVYRHCWSTDFIRHDYKEIGQLWHEGQSDAARRPASCTRLSPSAELLIAQKCCLWHYPGCINATGYNKCRHQPHCINSVTGLPARECQLVNTPWLWIANDLKPYLERQAVNTTNASTSTA